jgi:TP901 family phage tail tape measure protein
VTVGDLIIRIGTDNSGLEEGISKAADTVDRAATRIGSAGKALTLGLTVPLVAAAGAGFKFANDFNRGMANIGTLIPGNTERVQELGKAIQKMSMDSGKSTDDLVGGMYQVISAFGDTEDSVKMLEINMRAAVAGMATTADAINLTSAVTKAYGDTSAEAVEKASDLALMTVRLGQTTFPELASSMQRVTAMGSALGVSQEELFGTFATFTGVTGGAAEVSTQLAAILRGLAKPTDLLSASLERAGIASGQALLEQRGLAGAMQFIADEAAKSGRSVQEFTGRGEAMTMILAAAGGQADTFAEKLGAMARVAGTTGEAYDEHAKGIGRSAFEWDRFKATITVALQNIGQAVMVMLPALIGITGAIAGIAMWFSELSQPLQTTIVAFGAFLATLGPVLLIVSKVLAAKAALTVAAAGLGLTIGGLLLPIVGIVAALIGIGVAVFMVVKHWDKLKASAIALGQTIAAWFGKSDMLNGLVDAAKKVAGAWIAFGELVRAVVVKIVTAISQHLWGNIKKDMDNITAVLGGVGRAFEYLWDLIKRFVSFIIRDFKQGLSDAFGSIGRLAERATGFFRKMHEDVVGNSYVPDMVAGIKREFGLLQSVMVAPTRAATADVSKAFDAMSLSKTGAAEVVGRYESAVSRLRSQRFDLMLERDAKAAIELRKEIAETEQLVNRLAVAVGAIKNVRIDLKIAKPKEKEPLAIGVRPETLKPVTEAITLLGTRTEHTVGSMDLFTIGLQDAWGDFQYLTDQMSETNLWLYHFGQGLARAGVQANDFAVPLNATSIGLNAMQQSLRMMPPLMKDFASSILSAIKSARASGGSIMGSIAGGLLSGGASMLIGAGMNVITRGISSLFSRRSKRNLVPAVDYATSRINNLGKAADATAGALNAPSGYRFEPLRIHEAQAPRVERAPAPVVHHHHYNNRFDIDVNARERPPGELYEDWMAEARRRSAANFGTTDDWSNL